MKFPEKNRTFETRSHLAAWVGALVAILLVLFALDCIGADYTVIHNFDGDNGDGAYPATGLIRGADGSLFGVTPMGGISNLGAIFRIAPDETNSTILCSFTNTSEGTSPNGSLVQSTDGALYGTASVGDAFNLGTVFKIGTNGSGYAPLKSFGSGDDGSYPEAGLIIDEKGTMYGTTSHFGPNGAGTVFKLNQDGSNFGTLHSFPSYAADGDRPLAGLIRGIDGALYGTTLLGGSNNVGTVYTLNTNGGGYRVLYNFTGGPDGSHPQASLIQGSEGTLYGTTYSNGIHNLGTVFMLKTNGSGYRVLHDYSGFPLDGAYPAGLAQGSDGTIFGTTSLGGENNGGTIFKMNQEGSDYLVLHSFAAGEETGPSMALLVDRDKVLYGTTLNGGLRYGTVFKFSLPCPYSLTPASTSVGPGSGPGSFSVNGGVGCRWTAISGDGWIHSTSNGSGNGTVTYTVDANPSIGARIGHITVGGQMFTVMQAGQPIFVYTVTPNAGANGGISPSAPQTVLSGGNILFTAIPANGYIVDQWLVNGLMVQSGGAGFTLRNVGADTSVQVTFKAALPAAYTITTSSFPTNGGTTTGGGTFADGNSVTVTATANSGYSFTNWTEGANVVSTAPNYTFLVSEDRNLAANFVPKPFVAINGSYSGLFYEANGVAQQSSGLFTATTTKSGSFTVKLQLGSVRYSKTGKFDALGTARITVTSPGRGSIDVGLQMDSADRMIGTVSSATWTAGLLANRAVFNAKTNRAALAGQYTFVIPGMEDETSQPAGDGYGTASIDAGGSVRLAGSLADGTKFSQTTILSQDGRWPFYVPLYSGQGSILSWVAAANSSDANLSGDLTWTKPVVPTAKFYSGGFQMKADLTGSRYSPAGNGRKVINLSEAQVLLSRGNLAQDMVSPIVLRSDNRVTDTSSNKLHMTFTLSTGLFRGTLLNPSNSKPISFSGVVMQNENSGSGYFLGTNQSGKVVLGQRE